jgi:outer membrane protein, heavy metal efflux system
MRVPRSIFAISICASLMQACTTIPAQQAAQSETLVKARSTVATAGLNAANAKEEVARILSAPLHVDDAVRIAFMQSPRMHAIYAQLGFAHADVYDASRLSNPALGYTRMTGDGGVVKTNWSLSQSFVELLFLNYRTRMGKSQLLQTQQTVAHEVLALEAEVRSAYYTSVCANLIGQMQAHVASLAAASAQYAQQLHAAGNVDALHLARENAAAAEARIALRNSELRENAAQSGLLNLLGITVAESQTAPKVSTQLPLPIKVTADTERLTEYGMAQRLDLAALREQVRMYDSGLHHAQRWRWLGGVQAVAEREKQADELLKGAGVEVELPIFNQGRGNLLRAQANQQLAKASLAKMEIEITNDIQLRLAALQAAAQNVDDYRKDIVPLHEQIVALRQKEQNFMLVGAFELMAEKKQELDAYQAYLEAVRDYWIAHTDLRRTLGGSLPPGAESEKSADAVGIDGVVPGPTTGVMPR